MRVRSIFTAGLTGFLIVGAAWAGIGLAPVDQKLPGSGTASVSAPATVPLAITGVDLAADELLAGAAKVSIEPAPDAAKGEVWVHADPANAAATAAARAKCLPLTSGDVSGTTTYAPDRKSPWVENTSCIYAGGFGLGPSQPLVSYDQTYGLWSRSAAFSRGGKTLVLTILDGEGYFSKYANMCPPEQPCGSFDLADQLGSELGIPAANFVFAATHAHSAPDFIGGWGGVPVWYMRQVANAMRQSVRDAVAALQPATVEAGDTIARQFNGERRDTYYSAEDPTLNWIRAVDRSGNTITTVGTYAAHATAFGGSWPQANADWPGQFDRRAEARFGGIGLMFEAGLGNMSARANDRGSMGVGLANLLPAVGAGTPVPSPNVAVKQTRWNHPVTNAPLGSLGSAGLFDHPFGGPASASGGKSADRPCASASATSATVSATAAKIGGVVVTASPGEIFSNSSNTVEERSSITALAIAQANDALGYMPQSFEFDIPTQQGPGFVQPKGPQGGNVVEYEEAYSIDRCFGDVTLSNQLKMLDDIAAGK